MTQLVEIKQLELRVDYLFYMKFNLTRLVARVIIVASEQAKGGQINLHLLYVWLRVGLLNAKDN
tara:strand:- start:3483 stop:3674 length:192 start_codon:yes stop_codon:yes gene_type:complete